MTALTIETTTLRVLVVDDHCTFAELLIGAIDREPDLVSVGHAPPVGLRWRCTPNCAPTWC